MAEEVKAEVGLATVGVRREEGEADSVEEREAVLELEAHAELLEVMVPHLEAAEVLEELTLVVPVLVLEVDAVGEMDTVLVLELVCVAEAVVERESELEAESL